MRAHPPAKPRPSSRSAAAGARRRTVCSKRLPASAPKTAGAAAAGGGTRAAAAAVDWRQSELWAELVGAPERTVAAAQRQQTTILADLCAHRKLEQQHGRLQGIIRPLPLQPLPAQPPQQQQPQPPPPQCRQGQGGGGARRRRRTPSPPLLPSCGGVGVCVCVSGAGVRARRDNEEARLSLERLWAELRVPLPARRRFAARYFGASVPGSRRAAERPRAHAAARAALRAQVSRLQFVRCRLVVLLHLVLQHEGCFGAAMSDTAYAAATGVHGDHCVLRLAELRGLRAAVGAARHEWEQLAPWCGGGGGFVWGGAPYAARVDQGARKLAQRMLKLGIGGTAARAGAGAATAAQQAPPANSVNK